MKIVKIIKEDANIRLKDLKMFRIKLPSEILQISQYMSEALISLHYEKHHATYEKNIIEYLEKNNISLIKLEEIITYAREKKDQFLYNNAGQVFNHNLFWLSLGINKKVSEKVMDIINKSFDNMKNFQEQLITKGATFFGSGWLWVVQNIETKKLEIVTTVNGDTYGDSIFFRPVIVFDLWEHAYYVDYKNDKKTFLQKLIENCINWEIFEKNLI